MSFISNVFVIESILEKGDEYRNSKYVSRFVYILKESIPKIPIKVAGSQGVGGGKKQTSDFFNINNLSILDERYEAIFN